MIRLASILTVAALSGMPSQIAADEPVQLSIPTGVDPSLAIDLLVSSEWQRHGIQSAVRCDDASFVRRVYLDLLGRIPTVAEATSFAEETDSDKRRTLINQLLESSESAQHLVNVFDADLMGRKGSRTLSEREKHGWRTYLLESFRDNRPWNQMAREMTLGRATETSDVRAGWFLYERNNDHQAIAEAISAKLFGMRIDCAQCHDHPLASEIQQHHYWGLVAIFSRGKNQGSKNGPRVFESAVGGFKKFKDLAGDDHDAELTFFESATIEPTADDGGSGDDSDENYVPPADDGATRGELKVPRFSRRQQFADQILAEHPLIAKAFVNRLWALYMGRGLVHPVDSIDSMHPPSHPQLLEWLSADFREHGYDVKRLIRHLLCSRCYQLDSRPADDQALPEHFAYALDKPLTAESLLRSIDVVLQGKPLADGDELMHRFRRDFPDVFVETANTTLSQALMLTNHPRINALFTADAQAVQQLQQLEDHDSRVRVAFRTVFNREPDREETERALAYLRQRQDQGAALGQMLWAMVASAEFRMNH